MYLTAQVTVSRCCQSEGPVMPKTMKQKLSKVSGKPGGSELREGIKDGDSMLVIRLIMGVSGSERHCKDFSSHVMLSSLF